MISLGSKTLASIPTARLAGEMSRGWKLTISMFLLFYYLVAGFWNSPEGPLKEWTMSNMRIIADLLAFEQTWNMFGPPIRQWNGHFFATITFADGSSRICELPRMEKMTIWEKFKREKLRKLFIDNLSNPRLRTYMPPICANIALANADPTNQPVLVTLTFKWAPIDDPDEKKLAPTWSFRPHTFSRTDVVYVVQPEDLL